MAGLRRRKDETEEEFEERKAAAATMGDPQDTAPRPVAARAVPAAAVSDALTVLNGIIGVISPPDVLDEHEFKLLVEGAMSSQKSSPTFRKYLTRFVGVTAGASFLGAVALVVFVRLQRHGVIPGMASAINGDGIPAPAAAPTADYWAQQEWARNHPDENGVAPVPEAV